MKKKLTKKKLWKLINNLPFSHADKVYLYYQALVESGDFIPFENIQYDHITYIKKLPVDDPCPWWGD